VYTTCRDLLQLNIFKNCIVHTGETGLDNMITWPCVARSLITETVFYGGEFVIAAEVYVPYTEATLMEFLDVCAQKNVAGILLFINKDSETLNKMPQEFVQKATELSIPVFELEWEIRSVDVIKALSMLIADNQSRNNSLNNYFKNIIFFQEDVSSGMVSRFETQGYSDSPYYLVRIELLEFEQYCKEKGITSESEQHWHRQFIKRNIKNSLNTYFPQAPICSNSGIIICVAQIREERTYEYIIENLKAVEQSILASWPQLEFVICVTQKYPSLMQLLEAFHESFHLRRLNGVSKFEGHIIAYNDCSIYTLFFDMPTDHLRKFYHDNMSVLAESDGDKEPELLYTLESYLDNDCNLDVTSAELFIHKNTLRYRLKKIEEVMGCSLKSTETLTMLYNCFAIGKYLKAM